MKKMGLVYVCIVMQFSVLCAGGIRDIIGTVTNVKRQKLFPDVREEKQNKKDELEQKKKELQDYTKEFTQRITSQIEETQIARQLAKESLLANPDDDDVINRSAMLNEQFQALKDIERTRKHILSTLDEFIVNLTAYLDDQHYEQFKKDRKIVNSLYYYSFNDLLRVHEMILNDEQRVKQLGDQAKNALTDEKNRERVLTALIDESKKQKEKIQNKESENKIRSEEYRKLKYTLYEAKKELAEIRLQESSYRVELLSFQEFVAKEHLALLKDYLNRIKSSIRVGESDVVDAKDALKKAQQNYFKRKEGLRYFLEEFDAKQKVQENTFEETNKQYNISSGRDLDDWSREPKQTLNAYVGLCKSGLVNASLLLLKRNKELIEANIALEDERFAYQNLQTNVKETYYKISLRRFLSEEQITQEIKEYETVRSNTQTLLTSYKEKMNTVADLLNAQKKIIDNIHILREDLESKRNTIFRGRGQEYALCIDLLRRAERKTRDSIEVLGKLTGVYSGIVSELNASLRIAHFIIVEAQSLITIWYRPSDAISWSGFTSIGPDLFAFVSEISAYIMRFDIRTFIIYTYQSLTTPSVLFALLMKLFLALLMLFLLYRIAPHISIVLIRVSREFRGFMKILSLLLVFVLSFLRTHIITLTFWVVTYCIISTHVVPDPYLYVMFYLFSIPYLFYLVYRFVHFFVEFNEQYEYQILAQDLANRFIFILSMLAYATIFLMLFRQAFLTINYYQPELYRSELPNILVAVNWIILQISLMLLITKEQLLTIIPKRNAFTAWLHVQVDHYYYAIFLCAFAIIVMSHPYVGFSRLVFYLVWGFVFSLLLLKLLFMLHGLFKRVAKRLFFEERDQVVRERFVNAKTWFGLSIIFSFLIFSFFGVLIGAKIWGWPITVQSAFDWLYEPLLFKASPNPITMLALFEVITFIMCGFAASYALNRFVLDKIFDLLLVDSGVQNMVTRILRYFIMATAVFLGLYSVNLGGLVTWLIAALGLSIGWVLKDPMADIVAYFIILVQRPIKIGDYIMIDSTTMGIVRKITARSVVLRRKNSTTYVVPNSKFITSSIVNWNYTRNFVAFEDLYVTVHYKEDPAQVKDVLFQIVHEHPQILRNPKVIVRLTELGNRGYVFIVRGYLSSAYTLDQWDISSDIRISIAKKFRELDISFALPVVQVGHYDKSDPLMIIQKRDEH